MRTHVPPTGVVTKGRTHTYKYSTTEVGLAVSGFGPHAIGPACASCPCWLVAAAAAACPQASRDPHATAATASTALYSRSRLDKDPRATRIAAVRRAVYSSWGPAGRCARAATAIRSLRHVDRRTHPAPGRCQVRRLKGARRGNPGGASVNAKPANSWAKSDREHTPQAARPVDA
jgi:hypothetical protein